MVFEASKPMVLKALKHLVMTCNDVKKGCLWGQGTFWKKRKCEKTLVSDFFEGVQKPFKNPPWEWGSVGGVG